MNQEEFEKALDIVKEVDEDTDFETFKDLWGDKLDDSIGTLHSNFVNPSSYGYYKGKESKFAEHAIRRILEVTGCKIVNNKPVICIKEECEMCAEPLAADCCSKHGFFRETQ